MSTVKHVRSQKFKEIILKSDKQLYNIFKCLLAQHEKLLSLLMPTQQKQENTDVLHLTEPLYKITLQYMIQDWK